MSLSFISFDGIDTPSKQVVHLSEDSKIHAVDLVMRITGHNRNYSAEILRRLEKNDTFDSSKFILRISDGSRGHPNKLLTFQDAIELVMVLPGQIAKAIRAQFANVITQYMLRHLGSKNPADVENEVILLIRHFIDPI